MTDRFIFEAMRDDLAAIRTSLAECTEMVARLDERVRISAEECSDTGQRLREVERKIAWIRAWAAGAGVVVTAVASVAAWLIAEWPTVLQ